MIRFNIKYIMIVWCFTVNAQEFILRSLLNPVTSFFGQLLRDPYDADGF